MTRPLTHLERLEAESIHIMREVVAEATKPVMLYSVGKDSSVMLHLARKAFHPGPIPFPMLHVASGWDFQALLDHRDKTVEEYGLELIVAKNEHAEEQGINPFDTGSALYSQAQLTDPLKAALTEHGFDAAFGGGRRDEEKARAKERVFSFRTSSHRWDPKNQRPELWNIYNARKNKGESIRVFPISNWTELDIWQYIMAENIDIVPLYMSSPQPTVEREGQILIVDDERFRLEEGEKPVTRNVRFRTLGCYPLTGATESDATDLSKIVQEMLLATGSERQGRAIDKGESASMEDKKQEGYF
ncbi:sulfate adenylyltransferase subunit CysD [Qipengyuania sp. DSG2-2]|uniref:sulfate adenylyltransferase subunit CysD n=1 Tax=Qipengyuania sp. DGS2-2 TaxID=3349631 RepID=UPI0036D31955